MTEAKLRFRQIHNKIRIRLNPSVKSDHPSRPGPHTGQTKKPGPRLREARNRADAAIVLYVRRQTSHFGWLVVRASLNLLRIAQNGSRIFYGRIWFLPGSFSEHGERAGAAPPPESGKRPCKAARRVLKSRSPPPRYHSTSGNFWKGRKADCFRHNNKKSGRYPKRPLDLEVTTRFELVNEGFADPCLTTWPRHHINKIPAAGRYFVVCGAADEARTRYLHLGKVALYQMSYGRKMCSLFKREHQRKWCLRSESNQ